MIAVDKHGNRITIEKASIGKLKAMMTYYEGVVYRANKGMADNIDFLISQLPEQYHLIQEELKKRGNFHWRFQFLSNIKK